MAKTTTILDEALAGLTAARKRLDVATTDQGRRKVRRRFLARLKAVRAALDTLYPRPVKAAPEPKFIPLPKVAAPNELTSLPFTRVWEIEEARLFNEIAGRVFGKPMLKILAHDAAGVKHANSGGICYFHTKWNNRRKWNQLCIGLCQFNKVSMHDALDLYRRFFTELVPTGDFELTTRHAEMLHRRKVDFTQCAAPESESHASAE